jgi:hypothetical protein
VQLSSWATKSCQCAPSLRSFGHILLLQAEWEYSDCCCKTVAHNVTFYQSSKFMYDTCAPGQVRTFIIFIYSAFVLPFTCMD